MDINRIKQLAGLTEYQLKEDQSDELNLLQETINSGLEGEELEEGLWDSLKAIGTSVKAGANAFSSTLSGNVWANKWDSMVKDLDKVQKDFAAFKQALLTSKWAKELSVNDKKSYDALTKLLDKRAQYLFSFVNDFSNDKGKMSGTPAAQKQKSTTQRKERVEPTMNGKDKDESKDDSKASDDSANKGKDDTNAPTSNAPDLTSASNSTVEKEIKSKEAEIVDAKGDENESISKERKSLGSIIKWKILKTSTGMPAGPADFDPATGKAKTKISLSYTKMGEEKTVPVFAIIPYPNKEGLVIFTNKSDFYSARIDVVDDSFKKESAAIASKIKATYSNR